MIKVNTYLFIPLFLISLVLNFGQNKDDTAILEKAEENIEKYRKGDASLYFANEKCNPLEVVENNYWTNKSRFSLW